MQSAIYNLSTVKSAIIEFACSRYQAVVDSLIMEVGEDYDMPVYTADDVNRWIELNQPKGVRATGVASYTPAANGINRRAA